MDKNKKRKHCVGCEQDFYNGNNPYGVKECWSLDNAKMESRKKVPMNQRPPWTQSPREVLSCFQQKGYVFVEGNRTC